MEARITRVDNVEDVSYFVVEFRRGDKVWSVKRRYSAFDELRKKITTSVKATFPSKQYFGRLSDAQSAKRRDQLEAWLSELCANSSGLPQEFVEEPLDAAKEDEDSAEEPEQSAQAAAAWDPSFMSNDPLAIMEAPTTPPPAPKRNKSPPPPSVVATASPTEEKEEIGSAPSFLMHGSKKRYEGTGEGLRDAVKNGDEGGVEDLLSADSSLAKYEDRQRDTMLHLACLFNHTNIALSLVRHGADPDAKNQNGETPLDLALPSLKAKIRSEATPQ